MKTTMKGETNSIHFLPNDDWAYFATFVLPDFVTHSGKGILLVSPDITHMTHGKNAVRCWFNCLETPLRDLSNRAYARGLLPMRACCVPEHKDKNGEATPLHFHALVSRSTLFEQHFNGINEKIYEQNIWRHCLKKKFDLLKPISLMCSVEIKRIYCIEGLKNYIMKNVDNNFNIQNIIDIK